LGGLGGALGPQNIEKAMLDLGGSDIFKCAETITNNNQNGPAPRQGAPRRPPNCPKWLQDAPTLSLRDLLGTSGGILGTSWEPLGTSRDLLGASWGPLGDSWDHLGFSWGLLGGGLWGPLGASWGDPWGPLGASCINLFKMRCFTCIKPHFLKIKTPSSAFKSQQAESHPAPPPLSHSPLHWVTSTLKATPIAAKAALSVISNLPVVRRAHSPLTLSPPLGDKHLKRNSYRC
jgi:hypothetical protein